MSLRNIVRGAWNNATSKEKTAMALASVCFAATVASVSLDSIQDKFSKLYSFKSDVLNRSVIVIDKPFGDDKVYVKSHRGKMPFLTLDKYLKEESNIIEQKVPTLYNEIREFLPNYRK